MKYKDYYKILGVERGASEDAIKKADEHVQLEDLRKATKVVALTLLDFLAP